MINDPTLPYSTFDEFRNDFSFFTPDDGVPYGYSSREAFQEQLNKSGGAYVWKGVPTVYYDPHNSTSVTLSHELDHTIHSMEPPTEANGFNPIKGTYWEYGDEYSARGSQILDYFGITDKKKQPLTGDMLRYAADHYVTDTGVDNYMTEFFNSITDFDKAAKWLNKNATMIAGAVGGTTLLTKK
jgi:hypothetical protein